MITNDRVFVFLIQLPEHLSILIVHVSIAFEFQWNIKNRAVRGLYSYRSMQTGSNLQAQALSELTNRLAISIHRSSHLKELLN